MPVGWCCHRCRGREFRGPGRCGGALATMAARPETVTVLFSTSSARRRGVPVSATYSLRSYRRVGACQPAGGGFVGRHRRQGRRRRCDGGCRERARALLDDTIEVTDRLDMALLCQALVADRLDALEPVTPHVAAPNARANLARSFPTSNRLQPRGRGHDRRLISAGSRPSWKCRSASWSHPVMASFGRVVLCALAGVYGSR